MSYLLSVLVFLTASLLNAAPPPKTDPPKKLNIVTTMTVISAIAKDIGGDRVNITSLTNFEEDPHFVREKPSFAHAVSKADLFLQIGRSLELWVPQVMKHASTDLKKHGPTSVSEGVKKLEIPAAASRTHGDIHPQGNPHIWLSPTAVLTMATNIRDALIKTDPSHKEQYNRNFLNFKEKLSHKFFGEALVKSPSIKIDDLWLHQRAKTLKKFAQEKKLPIGGWLKQAETIPPFLSFHTVFSFLIDDFGLKLAGQIEDKPGAAVSPQHANSVIKKAKAEKVKHIFAANYYKGQRALNRVAEGIGTKVIFVAVDAKPNQSYFEMMDQLLTEMSANKNQK